MTRAHAIRSWGGLSVDATERLSEDLRGITTDAALTRGLGRSYGDATLPVAGDVVACGRLADRVLGFDPTTGELRAEAGLSLDRINDLFLPRGWGLPVTPGTQFVTLGGMVAADVHGKNHHVDGTFGAWVDSLRMRLASGEIVDCSRERDSDLFLATLGGMGLTGHVLEVAFRMRRLPSPWIRGEQLRIPDLESLLSELRASSERWPFTAAWVDCLARGARFGRGVVIRGRWASAAEAPAEPPRPPRRMTVPFTAPGWLLSTLSLKAFNEIFYRSHAARPRERVLNPWKFFYPLDAIHQWQRLYGRRGFTQYQCVVPREAGTAAVADLLRMFVERGGRSFLSVIKDCGPEGDGTLSFPRPGISVALDIRLGAETQGLVDALNAHVLQVGGRVYLAKDAFTRPHDFAAMDPRVLEFLQVRRRWDPTGRLRSALSVRLLDPIEREQEAGA